MGKFDTWATPERPDLLAKPTAACGEDSDTPPDRSFAWVFPDQFSQEWVDDLVLQAHCVTPVWSDFALVQHRPTTWEIADAFKNSEDRIPFVADDSVIIVASSSVELLITVSAVPVGDEIRYQLGLHLLTINSATLSSAILFRSFCCSYGLLQYPDSRLIDEFEVGPTGDRENRYLLNRHRKRLVFLFPRGANLSRRSKEIQDSLKLMLSAFGVVISKDALYKSYKRSLQDRQFDVLAIAPGGEAWPIKRDVLGQLSGLTSILEAASLLPEAEPISSQLSFSKQCWVCPRWTVTPLQERREEGLLFQERWAEFLAFLNENSSLPETPSVEEVSPPCPTEGRGVRKIQVDEAGYPLRADDIGQWVDLNFPDDIVLLPRARRELSKVRHPEPRRIAQALELLAQPKLQGYRGQPGTRTDFDDGLVRLRMRDGFSNAQYLNGQTGDSYVVQYKGRRLFLERHLCSNSSRYNDARMIRIYYVYDRTTRKIVVGWLPTHLPTTQS